ncbi:MULTISPECIES: 5-oxoprolinase subunit PxpA [Pseudomonadati]|jgi:UPF0271 protein|uniref:5-oxoprolinase subunit PxpA n=1 Tax=Pseudomonadati TaxID=3379134 RepID=UPI000CA75A0B|nr:MAG: lactam utilization protein LamB [Thermodesulfobium narugense]
MFAIDLNSDIGESFGVYKIGSDEKLINYITSANIACGLHAGDPIVMNNTILIAKNYNVSIGAHPSYPDLQGFGRRNMILSVEEIEYFVLYQLGALYAFCKSNNVELKHVKAHGALYNMASKDINIATAVANAVKKFDDKLIFVGLSNSKLIEAGERLGLKTAREIFADRMYDENGFLVSRKISGSVIDNIDLVIERAINMVKYQKVTSISGKIINIKGDTICIHGDNPKAKDLVEYLREAFKRNNIEVLPLSEIIK